MKVASSWQICFPPPIVLRRGGPGWNSNRGGHSSAPLCLFCGSLEHHLKNGRKGNRREGGISESQAGAPVNLALTTFSSPRRQEHRSWGALGGGERERRVEESANVGKGQIITLKQCPHRALLTKAARKEKRHTRHLTAQWGFRERLGEVSNEAQTPSEPTKLTRKVAQPRPFGSGEH